MDKNMDKIFKIVDLLHKYKAGKLSIRESEELEAWLAVEDNRAWAEKVLSEERELEVLAEYRKYDAEGAFRNFAGRRQTRQIHFVWKWAAAIVLPLSIGLAVFLKYDIPVSETSGTIAKEVITAGGSKAILTLSGGKQVALGKEQPVYTRDTNGVSIVADSSNLVYERIADVPEELVYNELFVPRRGEYSLQLSDGTKVYLNAESKLKYPVTFGGDYREVELSGEAYFEVCRDTARPFIVKVGDMKVEVLGTVFNINAYCEQPSIRTTLVSGRVNVGCHGKEIELLPGEQACLERSDESLHKAEVKVAIYTAWKDGLFKFERESLENIMTVLERWYDVNVFYRNDALRQSLFSGDLKKYDTIEQHLKMLELTTNVTFVVNGNNVFVGYKES